MSTIKINELATGTITLSSLLAFADSNGIAFQGSMDELSAFLSTLQETGMEGAILSTDAAPTEDGLYPCSESGTYANFGGLVVDVSNTLTFISVSQGQTVFAKVETPISITIDATPTSGSTNAVQSGGVFDKFNQLQKPFSNLGTNINSKFAESILFVKIKGFEATDFFAITEMSNNSFGRLKISKFATKGGAATETFTTDVIAVQTGIVTHKMTTLNGESATVIVDWDAFGSTYVAETTWANGGLDVSSYVDIGVVNPLGFQFPFVDSLVNNYLLSLVKDIKIYGGEIGHEYIISRLEIQGYRVTIAIKDLTDDVVVCSYAYTATITDYNTLPSVWQLDGELSGSNAGVYAFVTFDWSNAISGTSDYTTSEQSGVYKSNIFTKYDVLDYLHDDKIKQVVTVGVGKDFSTLRLAVESLNNSFGESWGSSYHNQVMFLLDEGTFNATFLDIPKFCTVKGQGKGITRIERENTNPNAMFEAHFECKFQDLTIFSESNQYCIHSDDFNRVSQGNRLLRQRFDNVELLGGSSNTAPLFGSGLSSGQIMLFNNCSGGHYDLTGTNTGVTFSSHNTAIVPSVEDSKIIMNNCTSTDYNGVLMISLGGGGNQSELEINSCKFYNVSTAITGGVVEEWIVSGNTDCVYAAPTMLGGDYANIGVKFSGLNNTGVTIPAGTFVERTATKAIAVATTTDDVFGFVEKDILNGASGTVITSKLFHKDWVLGTKSNGKFGITSGAIDMSATDKKGFIINNDVTLY